MTDVLASPFGETRDEILHEQWDFFRPRTRRWDRDREHIQLVEKIGSFRQRQRPASPDWLPRSGGRLPRSDDYCPPVDAATAPPTTIATLRMDFLIAMSCS